MANAIKNLRPDSARRMMSEMSNRRTLAWVGVAAAFHVVLIFATSWTYIRDHWIDPAGAQARAAQADAQTAAQLASQANPQPSPQAPVAAPTASPRPEAADLPDAPAKAPPAARTASSDANPTSAAKAPGAKPGETPKTPSHDGFNLDDSNLK